MNIVDTESLSSAHSAFTKCFEAEVLEAVGPIQWGDQAKKRLGETRFVSQLAFADCEGRPGSNEHGRMWRRFQSRLLRFSAHVRIGARKDAWHELLSNCN